MVFMTFRTDKNLLHIVDSFYLRWCDSDFSLTSLEVMATISALHQSQNLSDSSTGQRISRIGRLAYNSSLVAFGLRCLLWAFTGTVLVSSLDAGSYDVFSLFTPNT